MNSTNGALLQINQLNKDAARIENQIEQKLLSYSKLVNNKTLSPATPSDSSTLFNDSIHSIESEIQQLVTQLANINNELKILIGNIQSSNSGIDEQQTISLIYQRDQHSQVLYNLQQEFKRLKQQRGRQMLTTTNGDQQHSSTNSGLDNTFSSRISRVLGDRDQVININSLANNSIDLAQTIRGNLSTQRSLIAGADAKLGGIRATFPLVDSLIGRIQQKKQKDMIILSFFIATCIIITFFLL